MPTDNHSAEDIRTRRLATLGEFLPEVVHEINNLMSAISGYAQLEMPQADGQLAEALRVILHCANQACELSASVLHFARPDPCPYGDVDAAVQTTLDLLRHRTRGIKGLTVVREPSARMPAVMMSTGDVQLVLVNLLKNAIDAVENLPSPTIMISSRESGGGVSLDIWNSGPPIPQPILGSLFTPFFTTKADGRGSGLGLSVTRHLVSLAGGEISASNPEGGGVCLSVRLPVSKAQPAGAHPEPARPIPHLGGRRVLVVDDEDTVREVLRMMFARTAGAEVDVCPSGDEALQLLRERAYDAVVLDLRMPGLSGQQVFESLPKPLQRRVVFVTGDTLGSTTTRFLSKTRQPALFKPLDQADLLEAVMSVVEA